ncbi:hypothetical protein FZZ93_01980 [Halomonas eurihalina]|uniref:General secretion pathway protein GspL n=1 Tax=Halomonas eurihalina TaxID=42566 RepID=A0A5D9DC04_HALER|nr:hypothetical protein [Halomonas eurihalina]MDR5858037.1 hypothetical protein [Halomonas eurihalina]TZG41454.1 hypothetical protein FZZ93_01980 [Halomonas eurihalina]
MTSLPIRLPRRQGGRRMPRPRLLLMPPATPHDHATPWNWTLLDATTTPPGGTWTPGDPLPEALQSAGHETILVLPPASATRFELTAPKGLKRDEWPLLVDRYRCDEGNGEPLTLARLDHVQGRLVLVGVARSRLQDWQATLARAGLSPAAWAPAFMGQPDPPERALCALPAGDDWMLRWHDVEENQAPGRCHWLSWPRNTALPPALAEREWYQPLADEDTLAWLAFLGRHLPHRLPRLAPQPGRGRSSRRLPISLAGARAWLPLRRCGLIVALLLLHGGLVAWQGHQSTREAAERQLAARFMSTPASADDASRRLAERASALADLAQRRARIEEHLAALSDLPDPARLQQLEVSGQRMRLGWAPEALSAAELEALRSRLAGLGQLTDTPTQLTLELDLSATEQGGQTP